MQGELAQVQWVSLHMQGASFPLHPLPPCPNLTPMGLGPRVVFSPGPLKPQQCAWFSSAPLYMIDLISKGSVRGLSIEKKQTNLNGVSGHTWRWRLPTLPGPSLTLTLRVRAFHRCLFLKDPPCFSQRWQGRSRFFCPRWETACGAWPWGVG